MKPGNEVAMQAVSVRWICVPVAAERMASDMAMR